MTAIFWNVTTRKQVKVC